MNLVPLFNKDKCCGTFRKDILEAHHKNIQLLGMVNVHINRSGLYWDIQAINNIQLIQLSDQYWRVKDQTFYEQTVNKILFF